MPPRSLLIPGLLALLSLGCGRDAATPPAAAVSAPETAPSAPASAMSVATVDLPPAASASVAASVPSEATAPATPAALPTVLVHKSPTCGCCQAWVEHLRHAGFTVTVEERDDLSALKQQLGIPADKASCHTAEVDGLVVEGHVPAEDIKRLLAERGDARGLLLPGMPIGSPGMESPDGRVQPYTVERLEADGRTTPYAEHGAAR